jgi:predicted Rossmann fold nucleotide-binding protein DprA/Smf involved in DNA uptake
VVKELIGTKNMRKILETIHSGLQMLSGQTEKLMKAVENFEKEEAEATRKKTATGPSRGTAKKKAPRATAKKQRTKGKRPATKKPAEKTATEKVVEIVEKANRPLDVAALAEMTGYDQKKVRNIVSRATKQGRINRAGRGLYVAAG